MVIDPNAEDIHTVIEEELTARLGDAGKRLHYGPEPERPGGGGCAAVSCATNVTAW